MSRVASVLVAMAVGVAMPLKGQLCAGSPMEAHMWTVRGTADRESGRVTLGSGVTAKLLPGVHLDGHFSMAGPGKAEDDLSTIGGSILGEIGLGVGTLCVGADLSRRTADRTEFLRDGTASSVIEADWLYSDWGASISAHLGGSLGLERNRDLGGAVAVSWGMIRSEGRSDYLGLTVERRYARWRAGFAGFGRVRRVTLRVRVEGAREDVPDLVIGADLGFLLGPTRD